MEIKRQQVELSALRVVRPPAATRIYSLPTWGQGDEKTSDASCYLIKIVRGSGGGKSEMTRSFFYVLIDADDYCSRRVLSRTTAEMYRGA